VVQMGPSLNLKINNQFISNNAGVGAGVHVWRSMTMQNSVYLISNNEFIGNNATQAAGFSFSVEQQSLQSPLVGNNTIRFENNIFIDNLAQSQSSALYLWFYGTANTGNNILMANNTVQIVGGAFINNTVLTGSSGAAVRIVGPANPPQLPCFPFGFMYPAERKWSYYANWFVFDGVQFFENEGTCSTCSGGALLIQGGQTVIKNCVFNANRAGLFGGAVVLNDMSSYLEIYNSSFSNNSAERGGADLYSFAGAPISFVNSTAFSLRIPSSTSRKEESYCSLAHRSAAMLAVSL